jgi:hypothetical protein
LSCDRTIAENGRKSKKITFQTASKKVPRTIFEALLNLAKLFSFRCGYFFFWL